MSYRSPKERYLYGCPPIGAVRGLRVSKLIKTRSDLLNFVLETQYVKEVFERELAVPLVDRGAKPLRPRMKDEDEA